MRCEECGDDEIIYEYMGGKFCEDCWFTWWEEQEIGYDTSFEDFKMGLKVVKESNSAQEKK